MLEWRGVVVQLACVVAILALALLHPDTTTISLAIAALGAGITASIARTRNVLPPGTTFYPPPGPPAPPYRAPQASGTGFSTPP